MQPACACAHPFRCLLLHVQKWDRGVVLAPACMNRRICSPEARAAGCRGLPQSHHQCPPLPMTTGAGRVIAPAPEVGMSGPQPSAGSSLCPADAHPQTAPAPMVPCMCRQSRSAWHLSSEGLWASTALQAAACPPQVCASMAFCCCYFQAESQRLVPEQWEALGLDTDAGGRQAIHKLQAWASSLELDAVREQDREVAAMHNRAEQFDPSTEAIFIPFQVCCIVTDQGKHVGRPPCCVCVPKTKQWLHSTSAQSSSSPSRSLSHHASGVFRETVRAAVCSAYLTDQMALA